MRSVSQTSWHWLIPVGLALAAYANTVPGDFVFDDVVLIRDDPALLSGEPSRIFLDDYWGPARDSNVYRPVVLLTYAMNAAISEQPALFHLVNVLLNAALALLVYVVLVKLLDDRNAAVIGASIYAALPIHTEAVANIVGRAEILAALAIFGAWVISLRADGSFSWRRAALVFTITTLGMLAKENAVVIPVILVCSALLLRTRVDWASVLAAACAVGVNLALRTVAIDDTPGTPSLLDNPLAHVDAPTRILNALGLLGLYAYKTVVPLHLSADYSYNQISVLPVTSFRLWLQAGGTVTVVIASVWFFRKRNPLVALGTLFFVVAFAPTANVVFPIGTIFGERLALTASFGFALLLCATWKSVAQRQPLWRGLSLFLIALLCTFYIYRTIARNSQWSSAPHMYENMADQSPNSSRSHFKAAEGYMEIRFKRYGMAPRQVKGEAKELFDKAHNHLQRAVEIYPQNVRALGKLGELYLHSGETSAAIEQFTKSLQAMRETRVPEPKVLLLRAQAYLYSSHASPQNGAQLSQAALHDLDKYDSFRKRRSLPPDAISYNFRGLVYALRRDFPSALENFDQALALRKDLPEIWNNRGRTHVFLKNFDTALADYKRGLQVCRERGILNAPRGTESARAFLLRIADIHNTFGNSTAAEKARQEAASIPTSGSGQ